MRNVKQLCLIILLVVFALPAVAQLPSIEVTMPRSKRTIIRKGLLQQTDSVGLKADSMLLNALAREADSLFEAEYRNDSTTLAGLRTDDLTTLDSLAAIEFAMEGIQPDTTRKFFHKGWFMSDSMSLSRVSYMSAIVPGYGQIYNKQYWKLPIVYGTLAAGLGLYIHENSVYKPLRRKYDAMTDISLERTPELDALQEKMIRSNTRRQLYLGFTIASYIYSIGDAAVNYSTNDVSTVKKATTLACICPGAGQIYNKSYWKVPFVIGGFASLGYCIDWNNRGFQRFKKAYNLLADYEAHPENYPNGPTDEFRGRYSASFIRNLRNNYRRNRDLCIILTGALYVLQIVDAHVDAHLRDYDVSDDLTMDIEPMVDYTYLPSEGNHAPVVGFNLNLKF